MILGTNCDNYIKFCLIIIIKIMNKFNTTFALTLLIILFSSCNQASLNYETYQQAKEANLFEKAWIPKEIVNEEIKDIFFQSNLDLNTCIFSFSTIKESYNFDLNNKLNNTEVKVQGINTPTWWNLGVKECQKFGKLEGVIIALDTTKGILYGWRTNLETINTFGFENIITQNKGKYPSDISFFENNDIAERIKKLTKNRFVEIVNNFNVQSPISHENSIYKLTGCKQHNCPSFFTTILFDAKMDNIQVIIDQNGEIQEFNEKGKISLTESLRMK